MVRYSVPVTGLIRQRKSWRSYRPDKVTPDQEALINDFIRGLDPPPFGTAMRFELLDAHLPDRKRMPGTYGVITGAQNILVGAMDPSPPMSFEDFGYAFESIILFCTQLGLATCWMGGTFSRALFGTRMGVRPGEIVPCVSPVGYRTDSRSLLDTLFALSAGSKKRRPFVELFFCNDLSTPLDEKEAGVFTEALEMVRLAPSAMNKQPWRVVKKDGRFHFFLVRTSGYKRMYEADLQCIDMGIAMCHFCHAAQHLGLTGLWKRMDADHGIVVPRNAEYRFSWAV